MALLFLVGKYVTAKAPPSKTYTLLTSVHNDADDANNYNWVIGIAQLKAFSCAKKYLLQSDPIKYMPIVILPKLEATCYYHVHDHSIQKLTTFTQLVSLYTGSGDNTQ